MADLAEAASEVDSAVAADSADLAGAFPVVEELPEDSDKLKEKFFLTG